MNEQQQDLLNWTPPPSDRYGETYSHAFDFDRLNAQQARVFGLMRDGKWRALREISDATGDPEASVSARLRDLRRSEFGGLTVDRRRRDEGTGTYEYRIDPSSIPNSAGRSPPLNAPQAGASSSQRCLAVVSREISTHDGQGQSRERGNITRENPAGRL